MSYHESDSTQCVLIAATHNGGYRVQWGDDLGLVTPQLSVALRYALAAIRVADCGDVDVAYYDSEGELTLMSLDEVHETVCELESEGDES